MVLGANGILGSSIIKLLNVPSKNVISRDTYLNWSDTSDEYKILNDLKKFDLNKVDIFVGVGVTDPRIDPKFLWALNYHLPLNLINATIDSGCRIITFGTIHENFTISNEYFASKRALGEFIRNTERLDHTRHFLLHTLYNNNPPSEHMFLGQIYKALQAGEPFSMSRGEQLREFHHVDDITNSVCTLLQGRETRSQDISAGTGIQISELAKKIFLAFGALDNLKLGVFPSPTGDNFDTVFSMTGGLRRSDFRDPVIEIPRIFKELMGHK